MFGFWRFHYNFLQFAFEENNIILVWVLCNPFGIIISYQMWLSGDVYGW